MTPIKRLLADRTLLYIAVLYTCVITILFFLPSKDLPSTKFSEADKVLHCLIYFVFINLWLLYLYVKNDYRFKKKWILILLLLFLVYGIIIEVSQEQFTDSRSADIFDVVANLTGSLLGIFFFKSIKHKLIP